MPTQIVRFGLVLCRVVVCFAVVLIMMASLWSVVRTSIARSIVSSVNLTVTMPALIVGFGLVLCMFEFSCSLLRRRCVYDDVAVVSWT